MKSPYEEVLNELQQLISQYRDEIPGGRRAWPRSIKSRARGLFNQGMSTARIAADCGLSYHTVLNWIPKDQRQRYRHRPKSVASAHFSEVEVLKERAPATVTVAARAQLPAKSHKVSVELEPSRIATVTVTLPGGVRIDGVTPGFLKSWLGQGGGR
jgi:hypothetical protein